MGREKEAKPPKKKVPQGGKKKRQKPSAVTANGMTNYQVYIMKPAQFLLGFLLGAAGGAFVLYIFFQWWPLSVLAGAICGFVSVRLYRDRLCEQRKKRLLVQFRDLMECLVSSYSVGSNATKAFQDARVDLEKIYGADSDIVQEVELIVGGMRVGMKIEDLLRSLSERSGLEDIYNFAMIFEVKGSGINLRSLVAETQEIIGDKIEMEQQIETMISSEKNELYIMLVMPIVMMVAFTFFSGDTFMANNLTNISAKLVGIVLFVIAYWMGRKIMDIKV